MVLLNMLGLFLRAEMTGCLAAGGYVCSIFVPNISEHQQRLSACLKYSETQYLFDFVNYFCVITHCLVYEATVYYYLLCYEKMA